MDLPSTANDCIAHIIRLPHPVPPVLTMGAWFSNTLCLTLGQAAYISHSVGHLDNPDACRQHEQIARQLLAILDEKLPGEKPHAIAHDLHPDFHSSRFAARLANELNVPRIAVQHHHAHIAAICAEHRHHAPVLGLALDGVGLGTDNSAWGGELLQVQGAEFKRIGHLRALPLPGADRAAQEPWRMATAVLHELGRNHEIAQRFTTQPAAATVASMLQRGINCPNTSSLGRVFDAAASLLGLCQTMEYDAQAAIAVEQAAMRYIHAHGWPPALQHGWHITPSGQLDLLPTLAYLSHENNAERGAAIFHATLIAALTDWVQQAAQQRGITTIACGGGCFFNQLLSAGLKQQLDNVAVNMLTAKVLQAGDAAIALGQAWVAVQHFANRNKSKPSLKD